MNKIILRAITAFSRTDLKTNDDPLSLKGREKTWLDKQYVILENEQDGSLLAVYRCMNRGELKRLKRWQAGLTQLEGALAAAPQEPLLKKSSVPAILELAPIKSSEGKSSAKKQAKTDGKTAVQQSDLFE
ncbi:MAG: hypothetical protein RJB45_1425 [Pseudomonadota bacterium]|jgi:hypothetical protein